ncbi:hypothetical protein [uncultured Lactobacillus sp.]|uniref:hypothetical protein n=1 Tax=uncultured Lactobacillus sp. TaxID=153152 RepID=UPI00261E9CE6|nr:hypothetical protein [uncultured Lactobacillus sp.]
MVDKSTKDQLKQLSSMEVEINLDAEKMLNDLGNYLNEAMEAWVSSNIINYIHLGLPKVKGRNNDD